MNLSMTDRRNAIIVTLVFSTMIVLDRSVGAVELRNSVIEKEPAHSEDHDARLSLPALIQEVEATNPEIKAARQRWEASKALVPQVQTLPDPKLQVGYQRMPMVDPLQGAMYGIGQDIPFPGKLKLKGEVAQRDAEGSDAPLYFVRVGFPAYYRKGGRR